MKKKSYQILRIISIVLISGSILYFSNLHWLAQIDKPSIRGNHVGLAFLSVVVFWGFVLLIRLAVRKRT